MKKSNIILICVAVITLSWFLISGWLQANAYNIIESGKTCSYASVSGMENKVQLDEFKNIKINIGDIKLTPMLTVRWGKKSNLSYASSLKNALKFYLSLLLRQLFQPQVQHAMKLLLFLLCRKE